MDIAKANTEKAIGILARFSTAHEAALEAQTAAAFAEFDECCHSGIAFPCKSELMDYHYTLS